VKNTEPSIHEIIDLVLKQEVSPFIITVDVIQTLVSAHECRSNDAT